jgi:ferrous iron transport protein B
LKIASIAQKDKELSGKYPVRWLAIKLLEADEEVLKLIDKSLCKEEVMHQLSEAKKNFGGGHGDCLG